MQTTDHGIGAALGGRRGADGIVPAIFPLTPSESKRLIGRAVAALPEVRRAREKGWLVIARGTTNAYVAEELLEIKVHKFRYGAGVIWQGKLGPIPRGEAMAPFVLHDGQIVDMTTEEAVPNFGPEDVFIKGANAVDHEGNAGILLANDRGGTIGAAIGCIAARGSHLIVPVGLEKMIPSVVKAARHCGSMRYKYALGTPPGFMPLVAATVVTEIQALALLTGVRAIHVGSGGIVGSEGSVTLVVEGTDEQVQRAWDLVQAIKGEPPITRE